MLEKAAALMWHRPNLSYLNAVEKVADLRDDGYGWVFDADITKFFDNIEHSRLLQQVRLYIDHPGILCLIKSWISVGVLTNEGLVLPQKGIPQGAVISPILANIYLHEFDEAIAASQLQLVRYADDLSHFSSYSNRDFRSPNRGYKFIRFHGLDTE